MKAPEVRVGAPALESFLIEVFRRVGLDEGDARVCAESLVQTNLWGKDSHGVLRAPHYVRRLQSGALNPRPSITTIHGGAALEVLDGDDGPGHVVGRAAMLRAIAMAAEEGVGVVGVRRSSHFGAAAIYARLAADRDMIGIALTNSAAKIIAPGGAQPITGSNPIAVAAPSYGAFPFVLDVSLSALAGGQLLLAAQRGEKIPADVATDAQGQPTDDPAVAFAGYWLPMAGHKGLGLSYAVDILSGLITGAAFGLSMKSQYSDSTEPSGTGHLMMALNLGAIIDRQEFRERMSVFLYSIKSSPMRDDTAAMMVPGERAYHTEQERLSSGIPLPGTLYEELLSLGEDLGLSRGQLPVPLHLGEGPRAD